MSKILYKLHLFALGTLWCRRFHQGEYRFVVDRLRPDKPAEGWCWKCGRMWTEKGCLKDLMLKGVSEEVRKFHGL